VGYNDYDSVAMRWTDRALDGQQSKNALRNDRLLDEGDMIYSYGHHFEVARILRDAKRQPVAWLINGNTYSPTTSKHQAAVRNAIARRGLPSVTIPHMALDAAGVDYATVQIIDVQRDWETETVITKRERPGRWAPVGYYDTVTDDKGGWQNTRTGEIVMRKDYYGDSKPRIECDHMERPRYSCENYNAYTAALAKYEAHVRFRHGEWEEFKASTRKTGRKEVVSGVNGRTVWELVMDDSPGESDNSWGYSYERVTRRHWLGASLIRAAVNRTIRVTCKSCGGTGIGPERWHYDGINGEGPLTFEQDHLWQSRDDRAMERNGGIRQHTPRMIETTKRYDDCRGCHRTGKQTATRKRWAYYLSGFDTNETRPSYFFCELPPKVTPATVEEAYEALKPGSVKYAESVGREVKRQGDIFAIPMDTLETRTLKARGEYRRMPRRQDADPRQGQTADIPYLLNTNHAATEVVVLDGQTYARGTMVHAPAWREPDHKRLALGKTWHLIVKNTVPIGA
jgi:hypothetical protein